MRRQRVDSATGQLLAMAAAAAAPPEPPTELLPEERLYWDALVASRARSEWTDADLIVAAQLARCQHDLDVETMLLRADGYVLADHMGKPFANPRAKVVDELSRRSMAMARQLQITAAGMGRKTEKMQDQRRAEREAREALEDDDPLFARPMQ